MVQCLDGMLRAYKVGIGADRTKVMASAYSRTGPEIMVNCHTLWGVRELEDLGSVVSGKGLRAEALDRKAQALSAIARLKPIWVDRDLKPMMMVKLMHSIIFSIFLYACETWTLNADLWHRIWALDMCCNRKILNILYQDHVPNKNICCIISKAIGQIGVLPTIIKKHGLRWCGHMTRSNGLAKTIVQGTINGGGHRGGLRRRWEDNVQEWTGLHPAQDMWMAED